MINAKEFYLGFQADYYAYRALRLKKEMDALKENPTLFPLEIFDYSFDDHLRSIKIDIRQTYFQAIETLFELIFSLRPVDGVVNDSRILKNLVKRKDHYRDIRSFAEGKGGLDFLNQEVAQGNARVKTLQYLFYGLLDLRDNKDFPESLEAIIVANDLSDRREYNCYKHGLRIFPHAGRFQVHNSATGTEILNWDLKDSMTFIHEEEKKTVLSVVTKMFDPERDLNMIYLCNNLISNLIMIRRRELKKEKKARMYFLSLRKWKDAPSIIQYIHTSPFRSGNKIRM